MHRTSHSYGGAKWGLVGGKVEINEDPRQSVIREISEETGIHVQEHEPVFIAETILEYPDVKWKFSLFRLPFVERPTIILDTKEHQAFQWVTKEEANAREDLMPGLYVLLERFENQVF